MTIPFDDEGNVSPHDHDELTAEKLLIRGVFPLQVVPNKNSGGKRLSSGIFKHVKPKDHLSCDDRLCLEEKDVDIVERYSTEKYIGAVQISIKDLRSVGNELMIGRVPVEADPEKGIDENECHCGIWGRITKGMENSLFRRCQWTVEIEGVTIPT